MPPGSQRLKPLFGCAALTQHNALCRGNSHRRFATRGRLAVARLEPPVIDSFNPDKGFLSSWKGFAESTLAVVQLRRVLPDWAVPSFKSEAVALYEHVSLALAAKDLPTLESLTTPTCLASLSESIKARPLWQQHTWEAREIVASVKQVRFAHSASQPERRYAQVTCGIKAKIMWTILDANGKKVGGLGTAEEPYVVDDHWVFERALAADGVWQIKTRLLLGKAVEAVPVTVPRTTQPGA